jgi:hypothetical protein
LREAGTLAGCRSSYDLSRLAGRSQLLSRRNAGGLSMGRDIRVPNCHIYIKQVGFYFANATGLREVMLGECYSYIYFENIETPGL